MGENRHAMTLQELRQHRQEILTIAARYGAANVRVFGSVARGDAGPLSDVDLLIDLADDRSLLDMIGFRLDVADLLGAGVDVVTARSFVDWRKPPPVEAVSL